MDYLKSAVPSQLAVERGSSIVVINPGSANIRMGLAQNETPVSVPHCVSRHTTEQAKRSMQDQMLNAQITATQHMEREKAYDIIASLVKISFLDEEVVSGDFSLKMGSVDGRSPQTRKKDTHFKWTNIINDKTNLISTLESVECEGHQKTVHPCVKKTSAFICGEDALKISPTEPYCLRRPIRRGHFNVSSYYSTQQVIEDIYTIWEWILLEKLNIPRYERSMHSAILVLPETFDSREIKELVSITLRDLGFGSAVVYQEGLAAVFGNGLSTACVVNVGAQTSSVICIEDGASLPGTLRTMAFGGEDISRCLLWTQKHHQTWPPIGTDPLAKAIDLLMLNNLKECHCQIREGEVDAVVCVHSYEDGAPAVSHKTRLKSLNVPPMGLFYPRLLVPEVYPSPPRTWFQDYEDMLLEEQPPGHGGGEWDGPPPSSSSCGGQWGDDHQHVIGLAEAITASILSTGPGRIELQRRLFCSIQLVGGVASTRELIAAVEERVLETIPSHEAIDTVEVLLPPRMDPCHVPWKGGAVLGILDQTRIRADDWIHAGLARGRKYKESYFLHAHAMSYINS